MVEYVLLAGVNDSDAHAEELGKLMAGRNVMINIIPYNPNLTADMHGYQAPTEEASRRCGCPGARRRCLVSLTNHCPHGRAQVRIARDEAWIEGAAAARDGTGHRRGMWTAGPRAQDGPRRVWRAAQRRHEPRH